MQKLLDSDKEIEKDIIKNNNIADTETLQKIYIIWIFKTN